MRIRGKIILAIKGVSVVIQTREFFWGLLVAAHFVTASLTAVASISTIRIQGAMPPLPQPHNFVVFSGPQACAV